MRVALLLCLCTLLQPALAQIPKELAKAIAGNNPSLVNVALKSFGKVNAVGEDGDTPLLMAVRGGKYKAIKSLIKGGADLSSADASGMTAMHIAAAAGEARVMQVLLPAGVDPNSLHEADGLKPIHRAVLSGDTDSVKTLLNADVPADEPTADGRTPMDFTADLDDVSKVKRTASPKAAMVDVLKKFARAPKAEAEPTAAAEPAKVAPAEAKAAPAETKAEL